MEPKIDWPRDDYSRVPFRLHHDAALYEAEMERIFRGPAWSYLCLEAEIPGPGDFRTTWVGDTPVVVSRSRDGAIHAFVNRCSHRGAMIVRELRGTAERHVCLYHRWCYSG
ncbi:MAG: Rieske 2Fe-2S domain-containing protein, partial [Burkholderiales bacterium]